MSLLTWREPNSKSRDYWIDDYWSGLNRHTHTHLAHSESELPA